jgi:hypothetical protein
MALYMTLKLSFILPYIAENQIPKSNDLNLLFFILAIYPRVAADSFISTLKHYKKKSLLFKFTKL